MASGQHQQMVHQAVHSCIQGLALTVGSDMLWPDCSATCRHLPSHVDVHQPAGQPPQASFMQSQLMHTACACLGCHWQFEAEPFCMASACCSCFLSAASYSRLLVMVCRGRAFRVEVCKLALPKSLSCLLRPQVLKHRMCGLVWSLRHLQHVRWP